MIASRKRRTLADAERELAVARAHVEMLQAMNAKLVDALTHAATHPCPPVYVGPQVQPMPFVPTAIPLRVEPPYVGDPVVPPQRQPLWCHIDGANNAGCAAPLVGARVWTGTVGGVTVAPMPSFTDVTIRASGTLS